MKVRSLGPACRYYAVEAHYCDACGEEIAPDDNDGIRLDNGTELCYDCAREMGMLDENEDEDEDEDVQLDNDTEICCYCAREVGILDEDD